MCPLVHVTLEGGNVNIIWGEMCMEVGYLEIDRKRPETAPRIFVHSKHSGANFTLHNCFLPSGTNFSGIICDILYLRTKREKLNFTIHFGLQPTQINL